MIFYSTIRAAEPSTVLTKARSKRGEGTNLKANHKLINTVHKQYQYMEMGTGEYAAYNKTITQIILERIENSKLNVKTGTVNRVILGSGLLALT